MAFFYPIFIDNVPQNCQKKETNGLLQRMGSDRVLFDTGAPMGRLLNAWSKGTGSFPEPLYPADHANYFVGSFYEGLYGAYQSI